jgi:hypothetical protein
MRDSLHRSIDGILEPVAVFADFFNGFKNINV